MSGLQCEGGAEEGGAKVWQRATVRWLPVSDGPAHLQQTHFNIIKVAMITNSHEPQAKNSLTKNSFSDATHAMHVNFATNEQP